MPGDAPPTEAGDRVAVAGVVDDAPPTDRERRGGGGRRRAFAAAAVLALLGAGAAGAGLGLSGGFAGAAATGAAATGAPAGAPTIVLTATACGPGWTAPTSGQHLLAVRNASRHAVYEVDLVGSDQVSVYGELEEVAPGTTVTMDATLPPGRYSFECENYDGAETYSATETVTGAPVHDAHPYVPVTVDEIEAAEQTYRQGLTPILARFAAETQALQAAVSAGDLAQAESLWLTADLDWQRMGAVYDAFGNFDDEIDQSPLGLVGTVDSPDFTGLLRLEYGLWNGQSAAELTPVADALAGDAEGLVEAFPGMLMPDIDLALRTHEILENTLQFQLTGELDEGAGVELAVAWADVQGTQLALSALTPLLQQYDPTLLATLQTGLAEMLAAFAAYQQPDGSWTPLSALTTTQREELDGQLGALLQQLDLVPDVLDLPLLPPTADGG